MIGKILFRNSLYMIPFLPAEMKLQEKNALNGSSTGRPGPSGQPQGTRIEICGSPGIKFYIGKSNDWERSEITLQNTAKTNEFNIHF